MTSPTDKVRVWGIVPAAGMGRRMGIPKQSLPHQDSTIAAAVVQTLLDTQVAGVVVVTRTELVDALELPKDNRIHVAINDDATSEMIDSIRIALAVLTDQTVPNAYRKGVTGPPDQPAPRPHSLFAIRHSLFPTDGVLVVPADMPSLSADTCRKCIAAFVTDPDRIVIATHVGKRGHPIIFPLSLRTTVEGLEGGLRELRRRYPNRVQFVEAGDPAVIQDIDTLEDYDRL